MYLFFKKNVEKMFSNECFWFEEGTFCFNFNDKQKMIFKKNCRLRVWWGPQASIIDHHRDQRFIFRSNPEIRPGFPAAYIFQAGRQGRQVAPAELNSQ